MSVMMRTHRQGRTGATFVASRETPARRLLATLRNICRQLRRIQPDRETRQAYLEVERELAELGRKRQKGREKRGAR
jgi:hypothetical protein